MMYIYLGIEDGELGDDGAGPVVDPAGVLQQLDLVQQVTNVPLHSE